MKNSLIESHKNFLKQVGDETLLYKVVSFENFLKMIDGNYLHFNKVDNYTDDKNDSAQPEQEKLMNQKLYFEKDPNFTLRNYYEECRKRSYACCFSLDVPKAGHWKEYGGKEPEKAVCLVMNFGKLKALLNETFINSGLATNSGIILPNQALGKDLLCLHLDDQGNIIKEYRADNIVQIFHLNYGVVNYGDFANDIIFPNVKPNPIEYVHFKDNRYKKENELRVSLSAIGMGKIKLPDGQLFDFPKSIPFEFNLNQALSCGAISHIEIADKTFLPELAEKMNGAKLIFNN
jgi:hypothetical protein